MTNNFFKLSRIGAMLLMLVGFGALSGCGHPPPRHVAQPPAHAAPPVELVCRTRGGSCAPRNHDAHPGDECECHIHGHHNAGHLVEAHHDGH